MTVREEIRIASRPVLSHSADAVRAGRYVFGDTRPASTLVEVSALVTPGAKIEVDCVAVVP